MSLLVLVLGLSGIATAVLVWYVRWRRERRAAPHADVPSQLPEQQRGAHFVAVGIVRCAAAR